MTQTVFLIASRTGGPLIPLLALKDDLESTRSDLHFVIVGIKGGVEEMISKTENLELIYLPEIKLRHSNKKLNGIIGTIISKLEDFFLILFTALGVIYSSLICLVYLAKYKPKLIISTSNFLSVPMIWAAAFWNIFRFNNKIKVAIHLLDPQNTTIKLTKKFADLLTSGFPSMVKKLGHKAILSSNPVRRGEFDKFNKKDAKQKLIEAGLLTQEAKDKPLFLIFGGGSGAKFLNEWVIANIDSLVSRCYVLHLTGFLQKEDFDFPHLPNYKHIQGLTDLMPAALVASDLVMSRAGMSTSAELLYLRKPSFIVPIPDSHQEQNAELVKDYFLILDQSKSQEWIEIIIKNIDAKFSNWDNVKWDKYPQNYWIKHKDLLIDLLD